MAQEASSVTEKNTSYQTTNSYATLNTLTPKTENIWVVFHGMGYLSRYFLKPFAKLDAATNYIVAPQAPSKYYLNDEYKYVGASWLTKENTRQEIQNIFSYIDSVMEAEKLLTPTNLILFGFSQGVSIVTRWMASRKVQCKKLVMYAGSIPNELSKEDFDHLDLNQTEVRIIYGNTDKFLTPERLQLENEKTVKLFGKRANVRKFEGGHEIKIDLLKELV